MVDTSAALAEHFVKGSLPHCARREHKVVTRITLLIALGFVALWSPGPWSSDGGQHHLAAENLVITMRFAWEGGTRRAKFGRPGTVHNTHFSRPLHDRRTRRDFVVQHPGQTLNSVRSSDAGYRTVVFDADGNPHFADAEPVLEDTPLLYHPPAARIVAVGDLHGDFEACRTVLEMAGIAKDGQWIGGETVLVVLGDVLDRGHQEKEILTELKSLKGQAREVGGAVITLLGNHEILNFEGDMRYVAQESMRAFGPDRWEAFAPGGYLASEFASWPVVAVVGDTVFVHGGLPRDATPGILEQLNANTSSWISGRAQYPRTLLDTRSSPVWLREQSAPPNREPSDDCCKALQRVLSGIGASRVVVGHTPQDCVNCACDGQVWRCDTGMAYSMGSGVVEALEIVGSEVRVISESPRARARRGVPHLVRQLVRNFGVFLFYFLQPAPMQ